MPVNKYALIKHVHQPPSNPWQGPTLLNSWANVGTGYSPAGYYKDMLGQVHLRGVVESGASFSVIFNLPPGYRPAYDTIFVVGDTGGIDNLGRVDVLSTGEVLASTVGGSGQVSLDGILFLAEA